MQLAVSIATVGVFLNFRTRYIKSDTINVIGCFTLLAKWALNMAMPCRLFTKKCQPSLTLRPIAFHKSPNEKYNNHYHLGLTLSASVHFEAIFYAFTNTVGIYLRIM